MTLDTNKSDSDVSVETDSASSEHFSDEVFLLSTTDNDKLRTFLEDLLNFGFYVVLLSVLNMFEFVRYVFNSSFFKSLLLI